MEQRIRGVGNIGAFIFFRIVWEFGGLISRRDGTPAGNYRLFTELGQATGNGNGHTESETARLLEVGVDLEFLGGVFLFLLFFISSFLFLEIHIRFVLVTFHIFNISAFGIHLSPSACALVDPAASISLNP